MRLLTACSLACALIVTACAGGKQQITTPEPGIDRDATPYGTEARAGGVRGEAADATLTRVITTQCQAKNLVLDGRLGEVAESVARGSEGAQRAPSYAQVSHYAQEAGLIEPTPEVWVASADDAKQLEPSIGQAIAEAAQKSKLSHCGGAVVRDGARLIVALAWSSRLISLSQDVPAQIASTDSLNLRGELTHGLKKPLLAITDPKGQVSRTPLGEGATFKHTLRFPERGVYAIELLGEGPSGITVVANFPVAVGVAIPKVDALAAEGPAERSAGEVSSALATLIAKEREARKLPPLTIETRLAAIAQNHSQDMLAHGFIAHTSPSTGEASDRVLRARLTSTVVLENIGRGYSASEIHQSLMESPGHRGNILNPDARELGIGVVEEVEGDRLAFLATELFTRLAREVSLQDAPKVLARELAAQRRLKKLKPVKLDDKLAAAAQRAAERLAEDPLLDQTELLDKATESVERAPKGSKGVGAALLTAVDLDQVLESKRFLDPSLGWLGIGVARAKALTASPLIVVLVFATTK